MHGVARDVTMTIDVEGAGARDAVVERRHAVDERVVELTSNHFRRETSVRAIEQAHVQLQHSTCSCSTTSHSIELSV